MWPKCCVALVTRYDLLSKQRGCPVNSLSRYFPQIWVPSVLTQSLYLVCHLASDGVLQFSKSCIVFLEIRDLKNLLLSTACLNLGIYSF